LAAALLYGAICVASPAGPLADLTHYKYWTYLVTVRGMHSAYSGEYPETYAIYPPVTLATFRLAGTIYQRTVDSTFDLERALTSHELAVLIRFPALAFHLLAGIAVFIVARRAAPFALAYLAMLAYLFNPGVLFDVAQWGQPDPVFGLFVVIGLAAAAWPHVDAADSRTVHHVRWWPLDRARGVALGGAALAGAAIALAALAKPQAWVFLPLAIALVWRRSGLLGIIAAAVAGGAAGLVVAWPFLVHGTLRELIGLPRAISSVMPVVTANAHNLWWLATGGAARWYLDQEVVVGAATYRVVAAALVVAFSGLALLRTLRDPSLGAVFAAGAYTAFGFFMGMTQIHENHMYVVFPLLAVAAAVDRRLWPLYVILAVSWCANMVLHDFDIAEQIVAPALPWPLPDAQRFGALVNTLVLGVWTAWMAADTLRSWTRRGARPESARAPSEA
jgi:hypothetical protein